MTAVRLKGDIARRAALIPSIEAAPSRDARQLLDRYLETANIAEGTRVRPFVGQLKASAVGIEALDRLCTELRRCRIQCQKTRGLVDHRTPRDHKCDSRCRPHECNGLPFTTIRHIHFIQRGAFEKGVKWRWVDAEPGPARRRSSCPPARPAAANTGGSRPDRP